MTIRHRLFVSLACFVGAASCSLAAVEDSVVDARIRRDIEFLASDECEGRGVTTSGINKAADYIADQFKKAGLKPANGDGSWFQHFRMAGAELEDKPVLKLTGPRGEEIELVRGRHFEPVGLASSGKGGPVPVVFVGYGVQAKDYDDYADVQVAGKVVVLLRDTPRADNKFLPFDGPQKQRHGSITQKVQLALKQKAAAVLLVNDRDTAGEDDQLLDFAYSATSPQPGGLAAFHVRRTLLDRMLETSLDTRLKEVEHDIDKDLKPRSASLAGWSATFAMSVKRGKDILPVKNVVGVLEGKGKLANETVVVGAHYDHLGFGGGGSLARLKRQAIHHGADDNGSGTTALIELARRFGALENREGRRLVFVAFSAEESGLLGSVHYCKEPLFPLDKTVSMVNLDMVGRLKAGVDVALFARAAAQLTPPIGLPILPVAVTNLPADTTTKVGNASIEIHGVGTAKSFNKLVDDLNTRYQFKIHKVATGFGPSDHSSFYSQKIPVLFFFTGLHPEYHRPSDTANLINIPGMRKIVGMAEEAIRHLAEVSERPEYVRIAPSGGSGNIRVPRISFTPDYNPASDGVGVSAVTKDGPADKAGIKAGDIIVAVAGNPIKNMEGYMAEMAKFKKGDIELSILRGKDTIKVSVTPEYPPDAPVDRTPKIGIQADASVNEGVGVAEVVKGGPADKAGLKSGDVITQVGGKGVANLQAFLAELAKLQPGDVELTVTRKGEKMTIKVTPDFPK